MYNYLAKYFFFKKGQILKCHQEKKNVIIFDLTK